MLGRVLRALWALLRPQPVSHRDQSRRLTIELSTELPDELHANTLYLVGDSQPWQAALLCPCGCGAPIQLSLLPTDSPSWTVSSGRKGVTLSPSIWRTDGCRAHFFVRDSHFFVRDSIVVPAETDPRARRAQRHL